MYEGVYCHVCGSLACQGCGSCCTPGCENAGCPETEAVEEDEEKEAANQLPGAVQWKL